MLYNKEVRLGMWPTKIERSTRTLSESTVVVSFRLELIL